MNSYRIDQIMNGEQQVPVSSAVGGSGKFQKIRDLAAESLKSSGDAILLRDLVAEVKKTMELETRQAHNYTRNAVKKVYKLENINGVVFVIKS